MSLCLGLKRGVVVIWMLVIGERGGRELRHEQGN